MGLYEFLEAKRRDIKESILSIDKELSECNNCNSECGCGELIEHENMLLENLIVINRLIELYFGICVNDYTKKLSEEKFLRLLAEQMVDLSLENNLLFHCMNSFAMQLVTEYNSCKNNI